VVTSHRRATVVALVVVLTLVAAACATGASDDRVAPTTASAGRASPDVAQAPIPEITGDLVTIGGALGDEANTDLAAIPSSSPGPAMPSRRCGPAPSCWLASCTWSATWSGSNPLRTAKVYIDLDRRASRCYHL